VILNLCSPLPAPWNGQCQRKLWTWRLSGRAALGAQGLPKRLCFQWGRHWWIPSIKQLLNGHNPDTLEAALGRLNHLRSCGILIHPRSRLKAYQNAELRFIALHDTGQLVNVINADILASFN
jgi:hypothetical protein